MYQYVCLQDGSASTPHKVPGIVYPCVCTGMLCHIISDTYGTRMPYYCVVLAYWYAKQYRLRVLCRPAPERVTRKRAKLKKTLNLVTGQVSRRLAPSSGWPGPKTPWYHSRQATNHSQRNTAAVVLLLYRSITSQKNTLFLRYFALLFFSPPLFIPSKEKHFSSPRAPPKTNMTNKSSSDGRGLF